MKTNLQLQIDVQNAIRWEPMLNTSDINVTANDGVISLTGFVDSYAKKMLAEKAIKGVIGVKALVEKIVVKFPSSWKKNSTEIANEVLSALKSNAAVPKDKLTVTVEDSWVTLEGTVPWNYRREAAKTAIDFLDGVKGVTNNIQVKSDSKEKIDKKDVEEAISRSGSVDASEIDVSVNGATITLSGKVYSWYQKEEAGRIARKTPGIWNVKNELAIDYEYVLLD